MRSFIYNLIKNSENYKLFHADIFPYKHPNIIDVGNCESSLYHVAYGYALSHPDQIVLVFDVSSFSLEQSISFFRACKPVKNFKILIGGAGFVYYKTSHQHYCLHDISLAKSVCGTVFFPISFRELIHFINSKEDTWTFIRLMPDNLIHMDLPKLNLSIPLACYGWIFKILHQFVSPIRRISYVNCFSRYNNYLVIEDHIFHNLTSYDKWFGVPSVYYESSMKMFIERGIEWLKKFSL